MSHAEKYFCIHKAQAADAGDTTFRIEILEDGFGGSATEVNGLGEVFRLHYEKTDTRNPLESPIQKGRMEFIMAVEDSGDLAIVNEFVGADETQYQMRLKKDGSVIWTGYILSDLLSYSEDDYPIPATIVAKDLSRLSAGTYPLEDERETIITTIADILDELGFGLSIYTYTSWTEQNLDGSVAGDYDFLNRIYNETFALREYASSGDEADQPITNQEALQSILVNYGLILRQVDNAWRLYQLSALGDPTSVLQFEYNSSGVQQSSSTVNIDSDIDRTNRYVLPSSVSNVNPGLKRVRSTFNHRSRVAELTLPRNVYITGAGQESYSQSFISTGEQEIKLSGTLRAYHSTQESSGYADLLVRVGQYYFDGNNWTTTTTDRVRIDITGFPVQREDDDGNYFYYQGFFDISTPKVPGDATTPIEIEFENAVIEAGPDVVADETAYENIDFNIIKPGDDEANSAALVYQLRQSGSYSSNVDLGETLFGDGPAVSSKSALRYSTATSDITSTSWQRRGTTSGYRLMHENLFKELIDLQRTNTRNMNAEVYGNYSPANMISYDSENFFFLGGYLSGRNYWQASFLRINIQTASDTFETIIKSTSGGVQGSSSTSSGGGSGGIDQSTADARYFKQASLLSEASDLPTLYGNIGLDDGSADLDLNSLDINGSTFVDSSRNVTASSLSFTGSGALEFNEFATLQFPNDLGGNQRWVVEKADGSELFKVFNAGQTVIKELTFEGNNAMVFRDFGLLYFAADNGGSQRWYVAKDDGTELFNVYNDGRVVAENTLTINSQLLFTLGNEQLLSTDANVQFNEVDIGGNWKLDSESEGGIERLRIQALGVDDGAELFIQSKGSADLARITLTPDPSVSNYSFITVESNGSHQIINSSSEGTESTLPLSIRMDGAEALGIDTSRNLTTHANIADDGFSDWFSANPSGYRIQGATGVGDFRQLLTDELVAKAFTADVAQALAGSDILTKSVGILAEDFTIPAVSSSGTIVIEDLEGLGDFQAFEANDWLRIRIVDRTSSPAVIGDVYGQVTSYSDNTDGTQDWTFTVDYAGTSDVLVGQTVYKGAVILDYGTSGDTFIERTVLDRSGTSDFTKVPYDRIVRWTNGGSGGPRPSEATYEVLTQIGNINGLGGFTSATYGAYFKDNLVLEIGNGDMTIGKNVGPSDEDGIFIDSDDYWFSDGTGSVGDGILNWDASIPEVNISSFTVEANRLYNDSNTNLMEMRSDGSVSRFFLRESTGNFVNIFVAGSSNWGINGSVGGNMIFELGDNNQIAGINFDNSKLFTGDATDGYVGLGATSGATDRAFWAGAANADGSGSAGMYIQQDGSMILDTGAEIRNTGTDFTIDEDGITLLNDTAGQPTGATLKYESSTNTNLEIYAVAGGGSFFLSRGDFSFQRNGLSRLAIQDDVVDITNTPLGLEVFTDTERNALSPNTGWIIYNSDYGGLQVYNGSSWVNI